MFASLQQSLLTQKFMQNKNQRSKKLTGQMRELFAKIGRLRKKLMTYGYSADQIVSIILEEFLKFPKVDWESLNSTSIFYDIKDHFRTDASTTEMIMCLQKIVPNLHAPQVCQYLLRVLEFNSLAFGFNLLDSSSDSNQSNSVLHHRLLHNSKKRRLKNPDRKNHQKRIVENNNDNKSSKPRKKVHRMQAMSQQDIKKPANREDEFNSLFQNKPSFLFSEYDDNFHKKLRKLQSEEKQFQQWKQQKQSESEDGINQKDQK